ncbi:hypothetical protein AgCh_039863 [Apium graveolens]
MAVLSRLLFPARATAAAASISPSSTSILNSIRTAFFSSSSTTNLQSPSSPEENSLHLRRTGAERNVQWVFLGCPGVGKGTYAARLSKLLGVPHIATGDLVRHELASRGPLSEKLSEIVNKGKLVSDEFIIKLLSKRLEAGEAKGESGFILDGFPRTIKQAEILEGVTDIDLVINLKLREEALIAKCLGRRICSQCGGNYNIACIDIKSENGLPGMYMAPLLPPSSCESKLTTRPDDTEEVVKHRLHVYNEMNRGKLLEFDLPGGIPESWPKLLRALHLDDHEDKKTVAA